MVSETIKLFKKHGYRRYSPEGTGAVALMQKQIAGCVIHASVFDGLGEPESSVQLEIGGDYTPGNWAKLQVYSTPEDGLTPDRIAKVEGDLVRAWTAILST